MPDTSDFGRERDSSLATLFQLARDTVWINDFPEARAPGSPPPLRVEARRVENFLTEALALCVRANADPLLRTLRRVQIELPEGPRIAVTQQRVTGEFQGKRATGILDLLLTTDQIEGSPVEIWIEVKAGSPITAKQMAVYASAIRLAARPIERHLVVLGIPGPEWLPADARGVPFLSWQDLYNEIGDSDREPWNSLRLFLRERARAGARLDVIEPDRSAIADVLDSALLASKELGVAWTRPRRYETLRTEINRRADGSGFLGVRLWSPKLNAHLDIGAFHAAEGYALGVRLACSWYHPLPYEALRTLAARSKLDATTWYRVPRSQMRSAVVEAMRPISGGLNVGDDARWITDRLTELADARLLLDVDAHGLAESTGQVHFSDWRGLPSRAHAAVPVEKDDESISAAIDDRTPSA